MTGLRLAGVFVLLAASTLGGCGQKGPLMLPDEAPGAPTGEVPQDEEQADQDESNGDDAES